MRTIRAFRYYEIPTLKSGGVYIMSDPIFVTGCAGFIGMWTTLRLLDRGEWVVGIDNLNGYYDPQLKRDRLQEIRRHPQGSRFQFHQGEISDSVSMEALWEVYAPKRIIHLAAQAGVRYSLENPFDYLKSNLTGFLVLLERCRHQEGFQHFIYASSSSVYGRNTMGEGGFSESDRTIHPASFYAATKASNELMAESYNHLYGIRATGLRFFTVYGPWGRPDMAYYKFAQAIHLGQPLEVYGSGTHGNGKEFHDVLRDFTYIDDIVLGIMGALDLNQSLNHGAPSNAPHRIYNLGNNRPQRLSYLINLLEASLGKRADVRILPSHLGDVPHTWANVDRAQEELGYRPSTSLEEGIPHFVRWFLGYTLRR
jgi:UDP-glucuronate 4-epimerase